MLARELVGAALIGACADRDLLYHSGMETAKERLPAGLLRKAVIQSVVFFVLLGSLMFLPAGFGWRRGWLFLGVFLLCMAMSWAYLLRVNPEIFVARSKVRKDTKPWDKGMVVLIMLSFLAVFLVAGLDAGHGWSAAPLWVIALGYGFVALGFVIFDWVSGVNKFAEPGVRIQSDRSQKVIDSGPYAVVRHPMYVGGSFLMTGMALALGSYAALIPVGIGLVTILVRTVLEDQTLQRELEGYKEYTSRVRYRMVPGVW